MTQGSLASMSHFHPVTPKGVRAPLSDGAWPDQEVARQIAPCRGRPVQSAGIPASLT